MPTWMWLNIPLLVLVFGAVVGVSYWLVLRHPDQETPAETSAARTPEPARGTETAYVPAQARRERQRDHAA
jgi:hypothetical protein